MTTPVEQLRLDIAALETERETIYDRTHVINGLLQKYKTLLAAFEIVSKDPVMYDKWLATVEKTPRPE